MTTNKLLEAALGYAKAGIHVFPCDGGQGERDTPKAPLTSTGFKVATTDESQIRQWWGMWPKAWIGVPTGKIHCIDIDVDVLPTAYEDFMEAVYQIEGMSHLVDMLVVQKTMSGGRHLLYRVEPEIEPLKNQKLAMLPDKRAFIETRGRGGYICVAPSEGYFLEAGDIRELPVLTGGEREMLIDTVKSLNQCPEREVTYKNVIHTNGTRPGDEYGNRGELQQLLESYGWKTKNGDYWTRPGKKQGISATLNKIPNRFYVFTSSTEFDPDTSYTPFAVYTILEHGGDYTAAAKALAEKGYGDQGHHDWRNDIDSNSQEAPMVESVEEPEKPEEKPHDIFEFLKDRRFQMDRVVEPEPDIFTLSGVGIARPGNIGVIKAQPGSGKSSFLTACLSSTMAMDGADTLKVQSENPKAGAVIHIDTEQSRGDHDLMARRRILYRAGVQTSPEWFQSYCFTGLPYRKVRGYTIDLIHACKKRFGSVHSVWLDGIADMLDSPNNEEASNVLVTEFHDIAGEYQCPIWSVLHLNPGQMEKARGHLGSQLERKAETVLTIERDDDVFKVWTSKRRRGGLSRKDAMEFVWDDHKKMHVTRDKEADMGKSINLSNWA